MATNHDVAMGWRALGVSAPCSIQRVRVWSSMLCPLLPNRGSMHHRANPPSTSETPHQMWPRVRWAIVELPAFRRRFAQSDVIKHCAAPADAAASCRTIPSGVQAASASAITPGQRYDCNARLTRIHGAKVAFSSPLIPTGIAVHQKLCSSCSCSRGFSR